MPSYALHSLQTTLYILLATLSLVAIADPAPLAVPVGTGFYGYDGLWSGVNIRVGGPLDAEQWLTVFPFTTSQETWVVGPGGCDSSPLCQQTRGGLFHKNQSQTWQELGFYQLGLDTNLGDEGYADYGLDQISLYDQVTASDQIIAIINTTEFLLGSLGLGVRQSQFNGTTNHLTLLSSLVENSSVIPSHSYGYTAGAYYKLKTVPSSLTLGGVDSNRFVPNHATFSLDPTLQPVVAINEISLSCQPLESAARYPDWLKQNPITLLNSTQAVYATIDSSTPFLWLPEAVCDNFASALNLTYNDTLGLYFFQEGGTTPGLLQEWNMTFSFAVSDFPGSSNQADLAISYDAFNLQLSYPFPNLDVNFTSPSVPYFPLRRASNNTQYTIGRAFLQETYLTVDYERGNFSLSQAEFSLDALTNVNLIPITRPANSNYTGPADSSPAGLSTGAKAGIGAGSAVVGIFLVVGILFCVYKRRSNDSEQSEKSQSSRRRSLFSRLGVGSGRASSEQGAAELLGDKRQPAEVSADSSNSRFELAANEPVEMAAAEVPPTFFAVNQDGSTPSSGSRNDPRNPAELEPRNSMDKNEVLAERQQSPIPPAYVAAQVGRAKEQRFSTSISPNSLHHSHGFGTMSSGEQGISPVERAGMSSGSSRSPLSPVSPCEPRFPQLHTGLTNSPTSGSGRSLMAPYQHQQAQSRSPSRGSRFVEEGLDSDSGESRQTDTRTRFSWED